MQVLVWNWWNAHGLLQKKGKKKEEEHIHTRHHDLSSRSSRGVKASQQELLSFALRASEQTQKRRGCHRHDVVQVSAGGQATFNRHKPLLLSSDSSDS